MMLKPVININLEGGRIFVATRCFLTKPVTQLVCCLLGLLYWKILIAGDISHHRLGLAGTRADLQPCYHHNGTNTSALIWAVDMSRKPSKVPTISKFDYQDPILNIFVLWAASVE